MRSSLSILLFAALFSLAMMAVGAAPVAQQLAERATAASRITYYAGGMMANPACGGATPSSSDMVAAVKQGGKYRCGNKLSIRYNGKSVTVRVVDFCQGCSNTALDLSTGAFKRLAPMSQGVITGAKVTKM